ncbi:hypothetical protein [Streptomyces sasae]|uniref:hypothetical protein n=1 Tax=Streptomyces sasae TaxID=1266772 RepID=UPI002931E506|nr:hypothetical protein [Streptomyces sasae]
MSAQPVMPIQSDLTILDRVVIAGSVAAWAVKTFGLSSDEALYTMAVAGLVGEEARAAGYTAEDFQRAHARYAS